MDPTRVVGDWIFVSFPYAMSGDIVSMFNDATYGGGGDDWDIAKWYDVTDASDPWKTYNKAYPTLSDMPLLITNNMGIWLRISSAAGDDVITTGVQGAYSETAVDIDLYAGWNMVSYPSATPIDADVTLGPTGADWIAVYDSAAPFVLDYDDLSLVSMTPGNAYWIHVPADTTWTVNV